MSSPYAVEDGDDGKDAEKDESQSKIQQKRCVINPNSEFSKKWDLLMVVLLGFTALVTPFEVGFLTANGVDGLFVINRLVDFGFLLDMIVNFFLGYFDENQAVWIWNHKKIARRYLLGWFSIDLVSILPFDTLGLVMQSDSVSQLKILRIVRLLRLIKLMRIFRSSRIFKRIQSQSGLSFSTWALIKFLLMVLMAIHWTACAWGMAPSLSEDTNDWYKLAGLQLAGVGDKYLAALEFALMIMVMGYGDFTPANTTERVIAVIAMVICGSLYAYVIGAICGVVSERDPATSEYQQQVDLLNDYMNEIKVGKKLRTRLRDYFTHCKSILRMRHYQEVLENMSDALKGEVARHSHSEWLQRIPFFNAKNEEERDRFVIQVALKLHADAFGPNEMVFREGDTADFMCIVIRGMAAMNGKVITAGKFFGEDMVMEDNRRLYDARALTFLDVYQLSQDDLNEILENGDFPETQPLIRRQQIRLALRQKFYEILSLVKMTKGLNKTTKEEYEQWKEDMAAKQQNKQRLRVSSDDVADLETKLPVPAAVQDETSVKAEQELNFWLHGHVTGETRQGEAENEEDFSTASAVDSLENRMNKLEGQMSELLRNVKDGFQTMEASQEVAFRTFYQAERRMRQAYGGGAGKSPSSPVARSNA